ncbi:and tpr domain protein [Diplodia corticola]|uniref:Tetratricopeptide repeat and J domain-containing co-chaperone DNJ1 n=1 Tax=Diplodia corticola TaxID=236234 RepID=A0A1J9R607_9PEZI|nr:and tpr domain protein [Diplodia corticola]OJD35985.1 and tpr domain protein [Diplodia corticola]
MLLPLRVLAVSAALPFALALSPASIPADTPVSELIASANQQLAAGNAQDALTYFDAAVSRDPKNYLTIFKRGATYLSLGKNNQAQQDFDKVLAIKPDFEGALVQRAKLKSRHGDWDAARKDYETAGKKGGPEITELEEAQGAATLAAEAEQQGDWDGCITNAGVAVMVAGGNLELRKLRARCRFEKGEVAEGVNDLQHVLQINSGSIEPHLQSSAMTFYSLGETDKGLAHIRKCLQSDPDSKACMKLMKREKALDKQLKKAKGLVEKRQYASAVKLLIKSGESAGLLEEVKEDVKQYKEQGYIHIKTPDGLYTDLVEMVCEAYVEMNNKKRAETYCAEAHKLNPNNLHGLILDAERKIDADEFEPAIHILNDANEKAKEQGNQQLQRKIQELQKKAHNLLKRSKQKDYYKVLGVSRDADEREIKRAYRKLTKEHHPDKASQKGITPEEAQKKMASINEAYEVLSDPELKARFDNGDDPNDHEGQSNPFQGSPFGGPGGQQFFMRPGGPGGSFKFHAGGGGFGGGFPGGGFGGFNF